MMKSMVQSRAFIGAICFWVGVGTALVIQKYWQKSHEWYRVSESASPFGNVDSLLNNFYDQSFFQRSRNPFDEMRRTRERMKEQLAEADHGREMFDSWYQKRFGGGEVGDVKQREDDHFVYYDILIKDLAQEKVNVKVEGRQLDISGTLEKKTEEGSSRGYYSSSFHRSFPVPPNVDTGKMEMSQEKDKLVVKFPKSTKQG